MKRALWVALLVVLLFVAIVPVASAGDPYGYGYYYYPYGYVYPGSGWNRVCYGYYSYYGTCIQRFVPPYPVSGYYYYPYNTWRYYPAPYPPNPPYPTY
jgi:hypothetical protein